MQDACPPPPLFLSHLSPAALNAFVTSVYQMLFLRAALGAVLGGVLPILYSLFGDLFPPSKRSTVSVKSSTRQSVLPSAMRVPRPMPCT